MSGTKILFFALPLLLSSCDKIDMIQDGDIKTKSSSPITTDSVKNDSNSDIEIVIDTTTNEYKFDFILQ